MKLCEICDSNYWGSKHHVFYGSGYRKLSEKYGMTIRLCYDHHQHSKTGIHFDRKFDLRIKRKYQAIFEEEHGHEKFMEVFEKDYIAMEDWFYLKEY